MIPRAVADIFRFFSTEAVGPTSRGGMGSSAAPLPPSTSSSSSSSLPPSRLPADGLQALRVAMAFVELRDDRLVNLLASEALPSSSSSSSSSSALQPPPEASFVDLREDKVHGVVLVPAGSGGDGQGSSSSTPSSSSASTYGGAAGKFLQGGLVTSSSGAPQHEQQQQQQQGPPPVYVPVSSAESALRLLSVGRLHRTSALARTSRTLHHQPSADSAKHYGSGSKDGFYSSSRSHAFVIVHIESRFVPGATIPASSSSSSSSSSSPRYACGKLVFADLASVGGGVGSTAFGSGAAPGLGAGGGGGGGGSGTSGTWRDERSSKVIKQSLAALGDVLAALVRNAASNDHGSDRYGSGAVAASSSSSSSSAAAAAAGALMTSGVEKRGIFSTASRDNLHFDEQGEYFESNATGDDDDGEEEEEVDDEGESEDDEIENDEEDVLEIEDSDASPATSPSEAARKSSGEFLLDVDIKAFIEDPNRSSSSDVTSPSSSTLVHSAEQKELISAKDSRDKKQKQPTKRNKKEKKKKKKTATTTTTAKKALTGPGEVTSVRAKKVAANKAEAARLARVLARVRSTNRVPYAASSLTRLLSEALGGSSLALFIACANPGGAVKVGLA